MSSAVSIRQVTKYFGHLRALDKVSLEIGEGEFFGLLGPNGAGKTTLISALAGLCNPNSGKLSIMGYDVQDQYQQARLRLGVVPQELVFDPFFTTKSKGSGLGLSLVAQIVTAHQGRILTDTINGHTRFLVVLPVKHDPHYHHDSRD